MKRNMLREVMSLAAMLSIASIAFLRLLGAAPRAEEEGTIHVAESRVYSLKELAELMTAGPAEYYVDRACQESLLFVSQGSYPRPVFERAIEEGTGLKWREVGKTKFLGFHLDTSPDEETKNFAASLIGRMVKEFAFTDTPFTLEDFKPNQPDTYTRIVPFSTLPLDQQLWLAGRAGLALEGEEASRASHRLLTPQELKAAQVEFRAGIALIIGQYLKLRDQAGQEIYRRLYSNRYNLKPLRLPF